MAEDDPKNLVTVSDIDDEEVRRLYARITKNSKSGLALIWGGFFANLLVKYLLVRAVGDIMAYVGFLMLLVTQLEERELMRLGYQHGEKGEIKPLTHEEKILELRRNRRGATLFL
ncbi:hypothetical protein PVA45_04455 [Entomospira entomophila]|uniref:Uncharacterized protein n=1 Tax=Entomospira entomophila TaxID=2719988 RepID=A0A968G8X7_9SPIO|nr:hypothetical protein [Entomospira entomophilus]NIZ40758.1 hypothetical protein [Entomospira entomophilus]WDI34971.1 hypothetical protein PVA45_04455 [Entomospira entomophilus]